MAKKRVVKKKRRVAQKRISVVVGDTNEHGSSRLCRYAVAYALAIIMAVHVLLLSILAKTGVLSRAADFLDSMLITWNPTNSGILTGTAEAAVYGLVFGFIGAWLYNKFA